jgi:hypothetical protein
MKTVKCDISEVTLREDDVLLINVEKGKDFKLEDFNQLKKAANQLGKGRKFFNIIKIGTLTSPNEEAMEASCSVDGAEYKYADAFVISTLAQKLLGNLYMKYKKPTVPTRFFANIEAADKWIEELKQSIYFDALAYEL